MADTSVKGHVSILAASVMWGCMAPIAKVSMNTISPFMLTALRLMGGALLFWIFSLFLRKTERVTPRDFLRLFFASLFAFVINQGLFLTGLSMTSPVDASVITTMLPIFTMVLAAFLLREPVSVHKILGILLGAAGALILILSTRSRFPNPNEMSYVGDILGMLAQLSFACYLTGFKTLTQKYSSLTINKWIFTFASICYLPLTMSDFIKLDFQALPTETVWEVSYVVLFGTFLAYLCYVAGQGLLRPTVVSMYNYTQPVVASILAVCMGLGSLTASKLVAVALIFSGVYVVTRSKSRHDLNRERRVLGKEVRS